MKGRNFMTNKTNTALQVTNFSFYGDNLIALKDNATGEIYTSINSVLRGIGFTDKDQIRKRRDKWINDLSVSKGIETFNIPTSGWDVKNDTPSNNQNVHCISQHKLPLALAKINITPSMKKKQPELVSKLELYQDKCADVLASVFIDHKTTDQVIMQPILDSLDNFTKTVNDTLLSITDRLTKLEEQTQATIETTYKRPYNPWFAKMQTKYKLLEKYFDITKGQLYKNILWELENLYDIDTQQIQADYCYENNVSSCYPLEPFEFVQKYRDMIEQIVNSNLIKYGIVSEDDPIASTKHITIFDTPVET